VASHVLGHLDRSAVLEEIGDAGRAPGVIADCRRYSRLLGAAGFFGIMSLSGAINVIMHSFCRDKVRWEWEGRLARLAKEA
jgi:hypothetical protein